MGDETGGDSRPITGAGTQLGWTCLRARLRAEPKVVQDPAKVTICGSLDVTGRVDESVVI